MPSQFSVKDKSNANTPITIAPFRKNIRKTSPHKHNHYFEIIYLSSGEGFHWIDGKKFIITPPVLFFIHRDQIHHWELQNEPTGYVLIVKDTFLQQSEDEALKLLIRRLWAINCTYVSHTADMDTLFGLLEKQNRQQGIYSHHIIDGIMKVLISKILTPGDASADQTTNSIPLYARYLDLLNENKNIHRRLSYFAKKMGTTPQNLNAACRKAVNLTAGQLLTAHILGEAKRLLLYTDNTVSAIAYQLEFTDPSYFVKYFKKHLNITPEAFRKQSFSK